RPKLPPKSSLESIPSLAVKLCPRGLAAFISRNDRLPTMPMTEDRRAPLHATLQKALAECEAAIKPVFDAGAYHLPADELELLQEVGLGNSVIRRNVLAHEAVYASRSEYQAIT
ncbi:hypothetical protein, partial [Labrys sp. ZIDIC5]|uniref:hypothetical protein n=1 Tax=Labrys sedimenti TaxID=3106036 RepID=UPI002ACAB203